MALSRIGTPNMLNSLTRVSQTASLRIQCATPATIHLTSIRRYPDPPVLSLPVNVSDIFANETGRFTPERARDISLYSENGGLAVSLNHTGFPRIRDDTHVDSYDCFGAVSLSGTMQSNVPKPYSSGGKSMHLNMPGGQWARNGKYIAEDMQRSHYRKLPRESCPAINYLVTSSLLQTTCGSAHIVRVSYSTDASKTSCTDNAKDPVSPVALTKKQKFRLVLRDYGGTLIAVHITISLMCLGACYMIITSGVDVMPLVKKITGGNEEVDTIMKTSTDFVIAYTLHKILAPLRIGMSMGITPPLVRRLRRIGLLKKPKIKSPSL